MNEHDTAPSEEELALKEVGVRARKVMRHMGRLLMDLAIGEVAPPEDPGHEGVRGDPARVDEHGQVETGVDEPAPSEGVTLKEARRVALRIGEEAERARKLADKPPVSDEEGGLRVVLKILVDADKEVHAWVDSAGFIRTEPWSK